MQRSRTGAEKIRLDAPEDASGDVSLERRLANTRLTPAQRQVARYILDNPSTFAYQSADALARDVGVSQASVTRLAQELGYSGYRQLIHAAHVGSHSEASSSSQTADVRDIIEQDIQCLQQLQRNLVNNGEVFRTVCEHLEQSPSITVLGLRLAAPIADNFGFRLRRVHAGDVQVITTEGSTIVDSLMLRAEHTRRVLLVIAMPKYPRETAAAIQLARRLGYWVAIIVDNAAASVCDQAHAVLQAPIAWSPLFGSYAAANSLVTVIADRLARDSESARTTLIKLDDVAAEFRYYTQDSL